MQPLGRERTNKAAALFLGICDAERACTLRNLFSANRACFFLVLTRKRVKAVTRYKNKLRANPLLNINKQILCFFFFLLS